MSSWLYKDYSGFTVEQLNIILCWRPKNLIAQATEQDGPPSGNPARADSLQTIDPEPSLVIDTINTAVSDSSLPPCIAHFVFSCFSGSKISLLFASIDLHIINLCQLSPGCLAYPLIKPSPSLQAQLLDSNLPLPEQD